MSIVEPYTVSVSVPDLEREVRALKRKLRNAESQLLRNKAMLAAYTSVNELLSTEQRKMQWGMNLLLENSPDIILLFDAEGRFFHCTSTFLVATGIEEEASIVGVPFDEVFKRFASPYWVADLEASFAQMMRAKEGLTLQDVVDMGNRGEPRDYTISMAPMLDDGGVVVGALMLFHDQTDLVQAKNAAEKAREAAEKANIAKSNFLASMSREMAAPMNAILGMSQLAASSDDPAKKDRCIKKIEVAARHLLGVTNDILSLSQIENSKFVLSRDQVSPEKVISAALEAAADHLEEKNIEVLVDIADDTPVVITTDTLHLVQVLSNLVDNAGKFTPPGGRIGIKAGTRVKSDGLAVLRLEVWDTGPGMEKSRLEGLFPPFEQIYANRHRYKEQPGLGLSISKAIVSLMGGRIWAESKPGHGAHFFVELPFSPDVKDSLERQSVAARLP